MTELVPLQDELARRIAGTVDSWYRGEALSYALIVELSDRVAVAVLADSGLRGRLTQPPDARPKDEIAQ